MPVIEAGGGVLPSPTVKEFLARNQGVFPSSRCQGGTGSGFAACLAVLRQVREDLPPAFGIGLDKVAWDALDAKTVSSGFGDDAEFRPQSGR